MKTLLTQLKTAIPLLFSLLLFNSPLQSQCTITCYADINISIPAITCEVLVTPATLLVNTEGCSGPWTITLEDDLTNPVPNPIPASYNGHRITYFIRDNPSNNVCWGYLHMKDKNAISCYATLNVSLGLSCETNFLTPADFILPELCPDSYDLTLEDSLGNSVPNPIPASYVGVPIIALITNRADGNQCWSNIIVEDKSSVACYATLSVSLGPDCTTGLLSVDDFLVPPACPEAYDLTLEDNNGNPVPNPIPASYVGVPVTAFITNRADGNQCWSNVIVEDKSPASCYANLNVALGPDCVTGLLTPADFLVEPACPDAYDLTLLDSLGNPVPNPIPASYTGVPVIAFITNRADGNQCWSNVNVQDKLPPVITCKLIDTVYLDSSGNGTIVLQDLVQSAVDNCSTHLTYTANQTHFDCSNLGINLLEVSVSDDYGNTAICSVTIDVIDTIPPSAICQDIVRSLDSNGMVILTPDDIDNSSFDNCSLTLSVYPSTIICEDGDSVLVILFAIDPTGNMDSCTATITVLDGFDDGDKLPYCLDNCPFDKNGNQTDTDGDQVGNVCDNCPDIPNTNQNDADGDGLGDACDPCPNADNSIDGDGDGIPDCLDNCPTTSNNNQKDDDQDGVGNVCDNCPNVPNVDQLDNDNDGEGNACDLCPEDSALNGNLKDDDNDGVGNLCDNCSDLANNDQVDSDQDGVGDACDVCPGVPDIDTDGDGIIDCFDNCPLVNNNNQADSDNDGVGDKCDNCKQDANPDQADGDGDGKGDVCDKSPFKVIATSPKQIYRLSETPRLLVKPNPYTYQTKIEFEIPEVSKVKLILYDLDGKIVDIVYSGMVSNKVPVSFFYNSKDDLKTGIYILRLVSNHFLAEVKLVHLR